MYVLRVLNENDITANPYESGIISKKVLYGIVEEYCRNLNDYNKLSNCEKKDYIEEYIPKYIENYKKKLVKKVLLRNEKNKNIIKSVRSHDENYVKNFVKLAQSLSTLNNHLKNGSRNITEWISTTTSFECIFPYYDKQNKHLVCVIDSSSNGLLDLKTNTLAVDVSSRESLEKNIFLNKIDIDTIAKYYNDYSSRRFIREQVHHTKENFSGFNYSISSCELCYYEYIPKEIIVSVLEQLQIDLIRAEIFDFEFLKLSKKDQINALKILKNWLKSLVYATDDYMMKTVYHELYEINTSSRNSKLLLLSDEEIEKNRSKIMTIAKKIPNQNIKY